MAKLILRFCLIILFSFLPHAAMAEGWTAETLPMVHLTDATRYVCNPDNVLSASAVRTTDALLQALERDKGVQTVVVVVKHIEGADPYELGMALGKKYGIGSKKQRTGLIVVLATDDRKYQILTGNGLEATLPDALCRRVQNRVMKPLLKEADWDGAIVQTMMKLDGIVRGDDSLTADDAASDDDDLAAVLTIIGMILCGVVTLCSVVYFDAYRRCPKCGKRSLVVVHKARIRDGGRRRMRVTRRCSRCGHEQVTIEDDPSDTHLTGGSAASGALFGSGFGGSGGSSSFGGTFGGGSFGGGGSGGSF